MARTLWYDSKPQLYAIPEGVEPHQQQVGRLSARELLDDADAHGLSPEIHRYWVRLEAEVASSSDVTRVHTEVFELAQELERCWIYVTGAPLVASHLSLQIVHAPDGWTSNEEEVQNWLQAEESGLTGTVAIESRQWRYFEELPLRRVLAVREEVRLAAPYTRTLIELHYRALTSQAREGGLFFYAKGLELVRSMLSGRTDQDRLRDLPQEVRDDLHKDLHWLFNMANKRIDIRHVVEDPSGPKLHGPLSTAEEQSFRHDADSVIRNTVLKELGRDSIILRTGTPDWATQQS